MPPPCAYWVSHEITASLQGLAIGAPQVHRNLALFPLLAPAGARQNRVVNISILVGGGQRVVIPVSCVEHGRWSYPQSAPGRDFRSGNRTLFAKARAGKMSQVSFSMSERGTRASDQRAGWAHVGLRDRVD